MLALNKAEQLQHAEALEVLQECLTEVCRDQAGMLEGLSVFLHHPDSTQQAASEVSYLYLGVAESRCWLLPMESHNALLDSDVFIVCLIHIRVWCDVHA